MKGHLIIPVNYNGKQLELKGKLLKRKGRYGYKIKIKLDGGEVVLEEDADGRYKDVVLPDGIEGEGRVDGELVRAIARVVAKAVKEK